jgi:hypothetical protein
LIRKLARRVRLRAEAGMTTAEYAVGTVAPVGRVIRSQRPVFAGLHCVLLPGSRPWRAPASAACDRSRGGGPRRATRGSLRVDRRSRRRANWPTACWPIGVGGLDLDRRRRRGAATRLGTAVSLWGAVNEWVNILADREAFADALHFAAVGENVGTAWFRSGLTADARCSWTRRPRSASTQRGATSGYSCGDRDGRCANPMLART